MRVPVLSEHSTETAPNVSTVFNDLQRMLFCFMMLAVIVKLAVRAMGRPSGTKAMATVTMSTMSPATVIHDGCFGRKNDPLIYR